MFTPSVLRRGFNSIELLTALAVTGILAALVAAGAGVARSRAKEARCRGNLRQIGAALIGSANENWGRFPDNTSDGIWAWDLKDSVVRLLGRPEEAKGVLYCPAGEAADRELLWAGFPPGGFRVVGYVLLLPGTPSINPTELNHSLAPSPYVSMTGELRDAPAPEKELAVDATISSGYLNFSRVRGVAPTPHRANHLDGERPSGGNIVFLDGHVARRPFGEMVNHVVDPRRPWFWW